MEGAKGPSSRLREWWKKGARKISDLESGVKRGGWNDRLAYGYTRHLGGRKGGGSERMISTSSNRTPSSRKKKKGVVRREIQGAVMLNRGSMKYKKWKDLTFKWADKRKGPAGERCKNVRGDQFKFHLPDLQKGLKGGELPVGKRELRGSFPAESRRRKR